MSIIMLTIELHANYWLLGFLMFFIGFLYLTHESFFAEKNGRNAMKIPHPLKNTYSKIFVACYALERVMQRGIWFLLKMAVKILIY